MLKLKNLDRAVKRTAELQVKTRRAEHLDSLGRMLAVETRARVPVDDGILRASIRHKVTAAGKLLLGVGRDAWYWRLVEFGTEPHEIRARRAAGSRRRRGARVLASEDVVFGTRAIHPGMRPQPFVRPVIDEMRTRMTRSLAESFRRAVRR